MVNFQQQCYFLWLILGVLWTTICQNVWKKLYIHQKDEGEWLEEAVAMKKKVIEAQWADLLWTMTIQHRHLSPKENCFFFQESMKILDYWHFRLIFIGTLLQPFFIYYNPKMDSWFNYQWCTLHSNQWKCERQPHLFLLLSTAWEFFLLS